MLWLILLPILPLTSSCGREPAVRSPQSGVVIIERQSVVSSALASVGYDEAKQILEIEFVNGSVYRYYGVPPGEYRDLMTAASHGQYFNSHIKQGGYRFERVQ